MGGNISAWREDLISACDYVMDKKIVKMPEILQDERYIQWALYERWRKTRKGTTKFVQMQCQLESIQKFAKVGQEITNSQRALDFVIFSNAKDRPENIDSVPAVCIELNLAKTKYETSTQFRERVLKDIFRLAYLRHQGKTQKSYLVMLGTENQLFQVTESFKELKSKESKIKWQDLEESQRLDELKRGLDCTCPSCGRLEMSCLRSVVPKLKIIHERVVMHKKYWLKIWEIDAPQKR